MNIVVVDSGVILSHKAFLDVHIESYEVIDGSLQQVTYDNDLYGHGTAICSIISKTLQQQNLDFCLKVVKAFTNETTTVEKFKVALEAIYREFDADIINLSLGLLDEKTTEILNVCNKLLDKSIIVSAASNSGVLSIPCSMPGVIGVISDASLKSSDLYNWIDSDAIQMAAYGRLQRVAWIGPEYFFCEGNSFACANATCIIAEAIDKIGKRDYKAWLMKNSKNEVIHFNDKKEYCLSIPFDVKKVAVFPYSKETSSLLLFSDMLDFEICDIYDLPISGKVGAKVSNLLGLDVPNDYVIKNISEFDSSNLDTVVVGHIDEYIKIKNERKKIENMIDICLGRVNFYFFDPVKNEEGIFSPYIDVNLVPPNIFGMLYNISTPVLGVYGTSSKQGKFTLQLLLRKEFLKKGYKVGQLGTEPESLLFGFDSVYPMGYNSAVKIHGNDVILYLNRVLHEIEKKQDIDIILTGCQSGTVPYSCSSLANITIPETEFLFGTCPDVVVLCINIHDELDYINRTINYIESSVDTKVIAIVIYPGRKNNYGLKNSKQFDSQTMEEYIENLHFVLRLPIFVLNQEMEKLCDIVIEYLSE